MTKHGTKESGLPITPDEWRDALGEFLHAYLLNNEPQVHPRSLATAVWDWLQSQSPPYEAAVAEIERLRETLDWIAEPSYAGNFDDATVVEIQRVWARNALAGRE